MNGPLSGIRVLELGSWVAVPSSGGILSDWGADVLKIEDPVGGDPARNLATLEGARVYLWEQTNRNKRSVAIDLNREQGRQILLKLIQKADVFLTNFRRRNLVAWELTYDKVSQVNPSIIYAWLNGYGPLGRTRTCRATITPPSGRGQASCTN